MTVSAGGALAATGAGAGVCAGAVSVQGPSDLVRAIDRILEADGVETARPECGQLAVRAVVARASAQARVGLRLEDRYGRSSAYRVADAAEAASLIESWAGSGEAELAWQTGLPPAGTQPRSVMDLPAVSSVRRAHWIGSVDLATGRDRTTWYGSSVTDCAEVGVFCVGPRLRLARDDGFTGVSQRYRIKRKSVDVMMVQAYPMSYRRLALMPSAAFGFGWTRSRAAASVRENAVTASDLSFRAELSLLFAFRLNDTLSLGGEIGAAYTPGSSTLTRAGSAAPLPGPPTASLRAGLGFQLVL